MCLCGSETDSQLRGRWKEGDPSNPSNPRRIPRGWLKSDGKLKQRWCTHYGPRHRESNGVVPLPTSRDGHDTTVRVYSVLRTVVETPNPCSPAQCLGLDPGTCSLDVASHPQDLTRSGAWRNLHMTQTDDLDPERASKKWDPRCPLHVSYHFCDGFFRSSLEGSFSFSVRTYMITPLRMDHVSAVELRSQ